ncbi:MAG: NTP transferase domain-containing protein [Akkermansiaceae bacterium]|nr:NTP transferase domain-containing protein [Akkermansiaceae bacterium]MCP5545419.1 NTP transferase domain-containing protein [Akkermansiaceae bacterium]
MNVLIIAGGMSRRMGRDKGLVTRPDGSRQIDHIAGLAKQISGQVHLSVRAGTAAPLDLPLVHDLRPGAGPLAALEAAATTSSGPWLAIGCDLFLLDAETLARLVEQRDPSRAATCFLNRIDGRPEPLCTIYEDRALVAARAALDEEKHCARRFLESLDPATLDLPNPVALDNANTPGELEECFAKLTRGASLKTVRVLHFAKLREERGVDQEFVETYACTAGALYEELRFRHRLSLESTALRAAVNGDFAPWNAPVADGDEVVFIPPVAGG